MHLADWAESTVNLTNRTIQVKVYIDYHQGSLTPKSYTRLKMLSNQGIKHYWSKNFTIDNHKFLVIVNVVYRRKHSINVKLRMSINTKYARSHNSGIIAARFIYNKGFYGFNTANAVADFKHTCAHEFGHSVLGYFGGIKLSWGHKGSTHIFPQSAKKSTPGHPVHGDIDVLKYYDRKKNVVPINNFYKRSRIAEIDIKRLVWLSDITFIK